MLATVGRAVMESLSLSPSGVLNTCAVHSSHDTSPPLTTSATSGPFAQSLQLVSSHLHTAASSSPPPCQQPGGGLCHERHPTHSPLPLHVSPLSPDTFPRLLVLFLAITSVLPLIPMTVVGPPHSEDDNSPAVTPASTPTSSTSTLPSSVHPRSSFYSHRLQMWVHDKDSPLSSSTAGSFSFARSVAAPLPLPPARPSSPPQSTSSASPVQSSRLSTPPSWPSTLPSCLRHRLSLALVLVVALLLLLSASAFSRRWPSFLSAPRPQGLTMADYVAAHPLPLDHILPASADHTHSPSLTTPAEDAVLDRQPTQRPVRAEGKGQGGNFVSRAVHLEAVAARKRAAAIKVAEAEKATDKSKEERRDEEAQRMLGRLKKVIEQAGKGEAAPTREDGRGGAGKRGGEVGEVMDVEDDAASPLSKIRRRGDKQVEALQRRPS